MDELQEKIDALQYATDELGTIISNLKIYKDYEKTCNDLECYKSSLELDLEQLEVEQNELYEKEREEAEREINELERQYWKEAI